MSDITPADALRELRDADQAEYAAVAAKKLGLPESKPMLQAIRERWERDPSNTYPSDVGTLLAEVERLQLKGIEDCRVLHGYLNDRDVAIARRDEVLEEVRAMAARWVTLSRQAMDQDVREWASAAGHSVLGVLNRAALRTPSAEESP